MDTISLIVALQRAKLVSSSGGTFSIVFFPFSITKGNPAIIRTKHYERCTVRLPLPHEKFAIDGKNYFLFRTEDGDPKMCYRCLVRYISFSDENKIYKVINHA